MMKNGPLLSGLSLFVMLLLSPGCAHTLVVSGREAWIADRIPALQAFKVSPITRPLEMNIDGRSVEILGDEGFVQLPSGEWLYFVSCSSHDMSVADVILAIDDEGYLYGCNGHVCPSLSLLLPKGRRLEGVADFISTTSDGNDLKRKPWVRLEKTPEVSELNEPSKRHPD